MAEIESSLVTYLIAQAGIKSAFGSSLTRIYVDRIDPRVTTEYPFAIIRTVFQTTPYAHDGALAVTTMVQIDTYSTSKTTVNSGATAIIAELSALTGTVGSNTVGSSFIVFGELVVPFAVTVTSNVVAEFPVPTTIAVSTCAVPTFINVP